MIRICCFRIWATFQGVALLSDACIAAEHFFSTAKSLSDFAEDNVSTDPKLLRSVKTTLDVARDV